jgi:hypothetical protein
MACEQYKVCSTPTHNRSADGVVSNVVAWEREEYRLSRFLKLQTPFLRFSSHSFTYLQLFFLDSYRWIFFGSKCKHREKGKPPKRVMPIFVHTEDETIVTTVEM